MVGGWGAVSLKQKGTPQPPARWALGEGQSFAAAVSGSGSMLSGCPQEDAGGGGRGLSTNTRRWAGVQDNSKKKVR